MDRRTLAFIFILGVVIVAGATVFALYYISGNEADIKFVELSVDTSNFLSDLLTYKKLKFTLTYDALGGFVPVTCRFYVLNVKIEDVNVGSIQIDDFQVSGWWKRYTETFLLDLSNVPYADLQYIQNQFISYKNELKVEVEGSAKIDALVSVKRVSPSLSNFFLSGSPSVNLDDVYWGKKSAQEGELVDFNVILSNQYRDSQLSGTLSIIVREDISFSPDEDVETYAFSVTLDAGQSSGYSDSFLVYKTFWTHGFFLKVYWEGNLIYEMGENYPPRLRVE